MKHLFIINPAAGKVNRTSQLRETVRATLDPLGLRWEVKVTERPRHATELVREAAASGEPLRVYACGGDGTLNEVAAGAVDFPNVSITHWPTGSGNDFIKCFGDDAGRFFSLNELLTCDVSPMDVIFCNGRAAINVCSVGFDARVGLEMADFKRLPLVSGKTAYLLSLVKNVVKGINRHYIIRYTAPDGVEHQLDGDFALLCLCNGRYYGGSFNPSPTALPDDGLLDCVFVRKVSRITFARFVQDYAGGHLDRFPDLVELPQATAVTIVCDHPAKINLDGERIDSDLLSVSLSAKKVLFAHPHGSSWRPHPAG